MICTKCNRKVRGRPSPFGLCPTCRPAPDSDSQVHVCSQCKRKVRGRPSPTGLCPQCRPVTDKQSNTCNVCHRPVRGRPSPTGVCPTCRKAPKDTESAPDAQTVESHVEADVETSVEPQTEPVPDAPEVETEPVVESAPTAPTENSEWAALEEYLSVQGIPNVKAQMVEAGSLKGNWRLYRPGRLWTQTDADMLNSLGFTGPDHQPFDEQSANGAWMVYARAALSEDV